MIRKLKELTAVFDTAMSNKFLGDIQELGLVHIERAETEATKPINDELKGIYKLLNFWEKNSVNYSAYDQETTDVDFVLQEAENLFFGLESLDSEIKELKEQLSKAVPFGNLSRTKLEELKNFGIELRFYHVHKRVLDSLDIRYELFYTFQDASVLICVFGGESLPYNEVFLPKEPYSAINKKYDTKLKYKEDAVHKLKMLARYSKIIQERQNLLLDELAFTEVKASLNDVEGLLHIVKMWIPVEDLDALISKINEYGVVAYEVRDAALSEETPVLLKNGPFSKLFESITELFSLPNYKEVDLTPFFAPFFTMFFGICVGDAGYGIALFLMSLFMLRKNKLMGKLALIFSFSVLFWGVLTGTFFGVNVFEHPIPILSRLAVLKSVHMFYFALIVGLFQIFFGMLLKAFYTMIYRGVKYSLVTFGWIFLLFSVVGLYLKGKEPVEGFLMGQLLIDFYVSIAPYLNYGVYFGVFLILFFNDMEVPVYLRFAKGLWELYGITGFFGDLLSYIRLFALGISSAILGTVINSLAESLLKIPVPGLREFIYFLFLFAGHFGNMLLAFLGAFVHSLRLTFVEFYKNAGFEGGGKKFLLFKKRIIGR